MGNKRDAQLSRDGKTIGTTLRVEVQLRDLCAKIAARANMMDLKRGGSGQVTTQDVMRHQLQKLKRRFPGIIAKLRHPGEGPNND